MSSRFWAAFRQVIWVLIGIILPAVVSAGGSPETTLVVVNADSPASLQIANAYIKLRDIPPSHVVRLQRVPIQGRIDIETFRERIWKPIRDYLWEHHLEGEIDTIAYSGGFPYAVDFSKDIKAHKLSSHKYRGKMASLTGLTYFGRRVEKADIGYLGINRYYRHNLAPRRCTVAPRTPTPAEIGLQRRGEKALKKKDYQTAAEAYQTLADSYPWSAHGWYHLARSLAAQDRPEKAMEALTRAVDACWTNSLHARSDGHLRDLRRRPDFQALLERMEAGNGPYQPAHGFRSRYVWTGHTLPEKVMLSDSLNRYYLSVMLAYTGERGNTIPEVLDYLASAAASDGTHPQGTVYLLQNPNVRSETRQPLFLATVEALKQRGRRAEILSRGKDGQNGIVPREKTDVIGVVAGTKRFDWSRSGSRFLPGGIAESLTSYGGDFNRGAQTKLSEFLRHGAAGSSGAVAEPYSIQAKFPVPLLHVYYADGSSLAEAFYQSIAAPYQLIIVGDPLARPFARFARVGLAAPDAAQPWQGVVNIRPRLIAAWQRPINRVELWIDGRHLADALPGEALVWDTRTVEDGHHELRLIAVEHSRIETRSFFKTWVTVANTGNRVEIDPIEGPITLGADIEFSGTAPKGRRVEIVQGNRVLGSVAAGNGRWRLTVPSHSLGAGEVMLFARAAFADGLTARSRPVELTLVNGSQSPH